jgi:lysophospholipase
VAAYPSFIYLFGSVKLRALPNAPNGYTPTNVSCPANKPIVRNAATLSVNETTWLESRRQETVVAMKGLFSHLNMSSFNAVSYIESHASNISNIPNVGIAVSGGGYRALSNGAGALKALDSRTYGTTRMGHLGGLLQSATYLSGLSGGGWLLGSIYVNNFTTVSELQAHKG